MHNNSLVYKGLIKEFDENLNSVSTISAMYKIINFENKYFFAEELSTGCIFPIYYATTKGTVRLVNHFSHLLAGKYFAFFTVEPNEEKTFEYIVQESGLEKANVKPATYKEQQEYLDYHDSNPKIKRQLRKMEKENIYFYKLEYIKELITKQKEAKLDLLLNQIKEEDTQIDFK